MLQDIDSLMHHDAFLLFFFEVAHKALLTIIHQAIFLDYLSIEFLKLSVSKRLFVFNLIQLQVTVFKVSLELIVELPGFLKLVI
jgi:hypothetical protein